MRNMMFMFSIIICILSSSICCGMYNTQTGRFLQQDPLEYTDRMNLYEYVGSNSLRYADPYGTFFIYPSLSNFGNYKLMLDNNEEPDNTYRTTVLLRREYKENDPIKDVRVGDYNWTPYNEKYDAITVEIIEERVAKTIERWSSKKGWYFPLSVELLRIYMDNRSPSTGSKPIGNFNVGTYMYIHEYNHGNLISKYPKAKNEANEQARNAVRFIDERPFLMHGLSIRTKEAIGANYGYYGDLAFAIGGHSMWHKVENIRCNNGRVTADFSIFLWDVYDFDNTWKDNYKELGGAYVSGGDLEEMHNMGLYRAFFMYGKASKTLNWKYRDENLDSFNAWK